METTQELTDRALTRARTPSTTASAVSMPGWVEDILTKFQTCQDKELLSMKDQAQLLLGEMHQPGSKPRWLSFCGKSGAGKTLLCELIREAAPGGMEWRGHPIFVRAGRKLYWPDCIWNLQDGWTRHEARALIDECLSEHLLLIDDIGGSKDSEFSASALFRIIERRLDKWTLITSNRSLQQIADTIDPRISSRMIRDRNVCLEVNTVDFATRKA